MFEQDVRCRCELADLLSVNVNLAQWNESFAFLACCKNSNHCAALFIKLNSNCSLDSFAGCVNPFWLYSFGGLSIRRLLSHPILRLLLMICMSLPSHMSNLQLYYSKLGDCCQPLICIFLFFYVYHSTTFPFCTATTQSSVYSPL